MTTNPLPLLDDDALRCAEDVLEAPLLQNLDAVDLLLSCNIDPFAARGLCSRATQDTLPKLVEEFGEDTAKVVDRLGIAALLTGVCVGTLAVHHANHHRARPAAQMTDEEVDGAIGTILHAVKEHEGGYPDTPDGLAQSLAALAAVRAAFRTVTGIEARS